MTRPRIAIVGAGICGLTCASLLRARGHRPVVIEKSRGLGGRLATRQSRSGLQFDHGAQMIRAGTPDFQRVLDRAVTAGQAARWAEGVVGTPGMSTLVAPLATGLEIQLEAEVERAEKRDTRWFLRMTDAATLGPFDVLVSAIPVPQARRILGAVDGVAHALAGAEMSAIWALMLAVEGEGHAPGPMLRPDDGPIGLAIHDNAKPGRIGTEVETWVLHATEAWSAAHLELAKDDAALRLRTAAVECLEGDLSNPVHLAAHRWRFGVTATPLGQPFASFADGALLVGGDWALGPDAEHGFLSGQAMAEAVLARIGQRAQ